MRSNLRTRLIGSLHLPSLAGNGLPERMRSTAFAFLGLTAAAGLALVAIFAHLGFPLLAPTPLPSEPAQRSGVAEGVAVQRIPQAVVLPHDAGSATPEGFPAARARGGRPARAEAKSDGVGGLDSPSPVSAPPVKEEGASEPTTPPAASTPLSSPAANEDPVPAAQPDPAPAPAPVSSPPPKPAKSKPPKATAKPSKSKPDKPAKSKPVKEEPAKAEAKSGKPESTPVPAAPEVTPEPLTPSPAPKDPPAGKDHPGKALGHDK